MKQIGQGARCQCSNCEKTIKPDEPRYIICETCEQQVSTVKSVFKQVMGFADAIRDKNPIETGLRAIRFVADLKLHQMTKGRKL